MPQLESKKFEPSTCSGPICWLKPNFTGSLCETASFVGYTRLQVFSPFIGPAHLADGNIIMPGFSATLVGSQFSGRSRWGNTFMLSHYFPTKPE